MCPFTSSNAPKAVFLDLYVVSPSVNRELVSHKRSHDSQDLKRLSSRTVTQPVINNQCPWLVLGLQRVVRSPEQGQDQQDTTDRLDNAKQR